VRSAGVLVVAAALAAAVTSPGAAAEEREIRLTPEMRRGITRTLEQFVPAAVGRKDPALAWSLAGPGLRAGTTRADWLKGDMPVNPYDYRSEPFDGWRLVYAYPRKVAVDLLLHARPGSGAGDIAFAIDLVRRGNRWLVDSWYTTAMWTPPGERPFVTGPTDYIAGGTNAKAVYEAPKFARRTLHPAWFAVPGALLGLIVVLPIGLAIASLRRDRRAAAAHAAFQAARRS